MENPVKQDIKNPGILIKSEIEDDDWEVACSDEELYYGDDNKKDEKDESWNPSIEKIVMFCKKMVDGEKLKLEWESPGRRSPNYLEKRRKVKVQTKVETAPAEEEE